LLVRTFPRVAPLKLNCAKALMDTPLSWMCFSSVRKNWATASARARLTASRFCDLVTRPAMPTRRTVLLWCVFIVRAKTTTWLLKEDDKAAELTANGLTVSDWATSDVGGEETIVVVVVGFVVVVVAGGFVVVVVAGGLVVVVVGDLVVVVVAGGLVVVVVDDGLVVVVVGGDVVVVAGGDVVVVGGGDVLGEYSATQSTCVEEIVPVAGHAQSAEHHVCC
jgi:hypothetical protein